MKLGLGEGADAFYTMFALADVQKCCHWMSGHTLATALAANRGRSYYVVAHALQLSMVRGL